MANEKLKSWIAPDQETRTRRLETFKQYACYGLVALILLITVFVVPIIAGGVTTDNWDYWIPSSTEGWICWWLMKVGTVIGNLAVFGLFKAQGKTNAKDHPNYLRAKGLLNKQNGKKGFIPMSPAAYQAKTWGTKGLFTAVLTAAETLVIGSLIIAWDMMTFISCITSGITAIIFGIIQMIKDEVYWTDEYLRYAEYIDSQKEEKQEPEEPEREEKECLISETKNSEIYKNK